MKKLFCILLTMAILASVCVLNTNAALKPLSMGDTNHDDDVDILDVTLIQQVLAGISDSTPAIEYLGDVDHDNKLSVFDATYIQMWMVGLIEDNDIDNMTVSVDIYIHDAYADYDSSKAMAGVPVTFTVNALSTLDILYYELYVDYELVACSEDNSITYTFEKAGNYPIFVRAYNAFTFTEMAVYDWNYVVVEPYEYTELEITSLYMTGKHLDVVLFDWEGMEVHANANGGTAPYQYKFELTRPKTAAYKSEIITITQDYSDKNYFELEAVKYSDVCDKSYAHYSCEIPCTLTAYVKDANGNETTKTMEFYYTNVFPL